MKVGDHGWVDLSSAGRSAVRSAPRRFSMTPLVYAPGALKWVTLTSHRAWLLQQADNLFSFFEKGCINPLGGFYDLDDEGRPFPPGAPAGGRPGRQIHSTTRMVHCFAIAHLLGRAGADVIIDHGMDFIWKG